MGAPYKFTVDVSLTKDDANVLKLDINTVKNPYVFTLKAPRILPKILPTGRESIEFTADHKPGSYLKVDSNTNTLSSFHVVKLANGMRKISLNGKELVKAGYTHGDNTITQTTKLPNGQEAKTTVSWKNDDDLKENDVDIKFDATDRHMHAVAKWNIMNRDIHVASVGSNLSAKITGTTDIDNAPWPSPIETKVDATVNTSTNDYTFDITKTIAGMPYGVTLKNGR